jgi:hypothetical protein
MTSESWIEILALPAGQQPNWAAADSALRETNTYSQLTDEAELGDRDHSLDREDLRAAIATAREAIEDGTAERVSFNGLTIYLTWEHAWESPDISVCAAFDLLKKSGIAHIIGFLAQTDEPSPSAHPGSRADRLMASRETKLVLDGLVAELDDGDSDVADRVGSTYAFEIDTDSGLLHLLFRLESGNPAMPPIVAVYLGGQLATDLPPNVVETMLRRLLDQAPWLLDD